MTPRAVGSRHALDSCTLQLHAWRPFHQIVEPSKTYHLHAKKPCRSDRSTAPGAGSDALDLSRLSILDSPPPPPLPHESFRWVAGKRRRRQGSRSVSGRSSDRSGTLRRGGGGASAAYATCSDFPLAAGGTDSSGELFANGDGSWGSDASEARASRRESREAGGGGGGGMERESSGSGSYIGGGTLVLDLQGNESGYGSEPGYRGDAEFGYGDEFDEEEDDGRPMFWGPRFGGDPDQMDIVGENTFSEQKTLDIVGENKFSEQKTHHRCRRKKQEWRIIAPSFRS